MLTIKNTVPADAGEYECIVSNVVDSVSSSAHLTVHGEFIFLFINCHQWHPTETY